MMLSIITVNLNNCKGLERTIDSVKSQSVKNFEYIIIDGGSTDDSLSIIKDNEQNISFWVSEPDTGIYNAMNKGIAKATGKYLIFLNSGDSFCDSETFKRCCNFINKQPHADIYYGDIYVVNDKNKPTKWLRTHPHSLSLKYLKEDTINHQASLIKADLFCQFGLYPERYKVASDYWLYLNCLVSNRKYIYIGFPMVDYDLTGFSSNNYDIYLHEKELIWNCVVPEWVLEITAECEGYKTALQQIHGYKIINTGIQLNKKYQKLKKWLQFNKQSLL